MNTHQLQCVIQCDVIMRRVVEGVFPRDRIPTNLKQFPSGLIVNTDPKDRPGRHWLAFYFESEDNVEFLDSYGHAPEYFGFRATLYNTKRLQSSTSDVCGQYCLYYLLHRCRGVSMRTIVKQFDGNYEDNDAFVDSFISHSFPYCFNYTCIDQSCLAEMCK